MPVVLESAPRVPVRDRLQAMLAVAVARLLITRPPARLCRWLTLASRGAAAASEAEARRARRAVVAVSRRCAGQHCLQRSVAVALFARIGGSWPDWCSGVRTEPFRGHAWVEVAGRPVDEPEDGHLYRTVLAVRAR
ncbi:lasso peptide biosynthesis B2 protein [Cryptosporangium aurantiacum]|uniref:lasso peptide biosynthesis B2 protein n=1 Tax=Cryptosporangium aurantiacum TaxID=134849 RepID=UPI00116116B0|nr:lasso peptide biosynthesis B2 protein [Cryptosporangium aurantiacum]